MQNSTEATSISSTAGKRTSSRDRTIEPGSCTAVPADRLSRLEELVANFTLSIDDRIGKLESRFKASLEKNTRKTSKSEDHDKRKTALKRNL